MDIPVLEILYIIVKLRAQSAGWKDGADGKIFMDIANIHLFMMTRK
jgi:hypothetical protein